jgi:DNA-binding SARP family transcriptional activator
MPPPIDAVVRRMQAQQHAGAVLSPALVAPVLRIHLLGSFAVERDEKPIAAMAWRRRRPLDLLKLVCLAPGHAVHREEAIYRLWPDKDLESGANNLHRALHDLRGVIGERAAVLDKNIVRFGEPVWIDVDELEQGIADDDLSVVEKALALYRGVLCPDDPYAELLESRRRALHDRFVDASLRVAAGAIAAGDDDRALGCLRRVVELEPACEEAHRQLMRLLARRGRKHEALRQFTACSKALRDHLGSEPSAMTRALHGSVLRGELDQPTPAATSGWRRLARRLLGSAEPAPVRGRGDELARLAAAVDARAGVLLVLGEAGAGKTRLAIEAARLAGDIGALVLGGAALEEGGVPFGAFVEAWADHLRATGQPRNASPFIAFPRTAGGAPPEDKLQPHAAVEQSIASLGGGQPVALVIDDLQWADESSVHLFHHLARATRTMPLLLIATCRTEDIAVGRPIHALLSWLHHERLAKRLLLDRLDRAAVGEIVRDLVGRVPPAEHVQNIYRLAEGNAFFTEELARGLAEGSDLTTIPEDLADAVLERVARLGSEAGRLIAAAAALGVRFPFAWVHAASGLPEEHALDALETSLRAKVLEETDDGYRFRHPLVRESVYGALTKARRAQLHRLAAGALAADPAAQRGELAEALAHHYLAAGAPQAALPHLIAAGRRAAAHLGLSEAIGDSSRTAANPIGPASCSGSVGRASRSGKSMRPRANSASGLG